ncbi:MAG: hypothetical protein K2X81_00980, partial [Candidatus Obscuribacterales bacterium]|nr:hypothetical protein [Candidatus Obscuribacterales bacterium]
SSLPSSFSSSPSPFDNSLPKSVESDRHLTDKSPWDATTSQNSDSHLMPNPFSSTLPVEGNYDGQSDAMKRLEESLKR